MFRNLAVRQFLANANARPAPLQDPAGQGADPARVRAAAHHGRRAAGVAEPAPALPVPARLPGGPVLTPVVAEVPEEKVSLCKFDFMASLAVFLI